MRGCGFKVTSSAYSSHIRVNWHACSWPMRRYSSVRATINSLNTNTKAT
jgi:hypothetical protein